MFRRTIDKPYIYIPIIYFIGMFFFVSCSNKDNELQTSIDDKEKPLEQSKNVQMLISDNGVAKYILQAPVLIRYSEDSNSRMVCPNGLILTFFDSIGNEESKLVAKYGTYYGIKQLVEVKDSVVFTNVKNEKLETNYLKLDFVKDSCSTYDKVKVSNDKGTLEGYQMVSNLKFTHYEVLNLTGFAYIQKEELTSP